MPLARVVVPAAGHPMKCLAVCQDELIIRVLDEILLPSFEVEFLVENKALAKRLADDGDRMSPPAT